MADFKNLYDKLKTIIFIKYIMKRGFTLKFKI